VDDEVTQKWGDGGMI